MKLTNWADTERWIFLLEDQIKVLKQSVSSLMGRKSVIDTDDVNAKHVEIIGPAPQIHVGSLPTKQGLYFQVLANDLFLSIGVYYDGTNWIATHTYSLVLLMSNGGWTFYYNAGNVVGSPVTLTSRFYFGNNGNFFPTQPVGIAEGGTGGITAPAARTNLDVYSKAEVNALVNQKDIQIAYATANLNLLVGIGSVAVISGTTLVLQKAGSYHVTGIFDMLLLGAGDAGAVIIGGLSVNGVVVTSSALLTGDPGVFPERGTVSQQWIVTSGSPGSVTISLNGYKNAGSGSSLIGFSNTSILAVWVGA